ncbi:MAG TPA: primosomal protein N' [Caldilineaceae bacterium]|nr:primosomal protein N' [Caldilineaceae bacterium]
MIFVEVIVNRPIRPSFRPSTAVPVPNPHSDAAAGAQLLLNDLGLADMAETGDIVGSAEAEGDGPTFQLFHYHLPPNLEHLVEPGHLVWVPFGAQRVQGVVLRQSTDSPVPTRAVLRLARTEPVLTPTQLALAAWIADYYVAPLSETVKLFFPPGLLSKEDGSNRVRVKRELKVELQLSLAEALQRLPLLGRETQQSRVLAWMLEQPHSAIPLQAVLDACGLKSPATIKTLVKHGLLRITETADPVYPSVAGAERESMVQLALTATEAQERLLALQGLDKYHPIIEALATAESALWKSELYQRVDADLKMLRALHKAGIVMLSEEVRFRDPLAGRNYPRTTAPPLTAEQQQVWQQIASCCFPDGSETPHIDELGWPTSAQKFLLHGVTGSGKTEIYLQAIAATLAAGKQAIVLVPEIALTPQTVARFAGRFPGRVTVIHSGLNAGERYDVWRYLRDGQYDVVIGPRSALFAPLARLGLIIIDEEHESSYKQNAEEWGSFTVFYDARTVAERLAELVNAILIFGSATPSLERYRAAQQQDLVLLELLRRVMGHKPANDVTLSKNSSVLAVAEATTPSPYTDLPPVEIVDMRQELRAGHRSMLSRPLLSALHETLDAGEQAIFYLNRRGTRTFVMCRDCGAVQECKRCDIPLTFHENTDILICHHCNRRYPVPEICPECHSKRIKYFGSGTQRLEETIQQIVPHARIMRWDADTATKKGSHEAILRRFADHEADILVGTQMIAKGLDFPLVTLVGVVAADVGLYLPDFRSGERAFQLLTQVAGRAGRSDRGGRVVIQSYKPDHYAIQAAAQHDYHAFFAREIAFRREHGYPPLRSMARLIYWDKSLERAQEASTAMAETLRRRLAQMGMAGEGAIVLGPAPAFFARYRSYYRWQVILRAPQPAQILRGLPIPFGWRIDIDPVSML